MIFLCEIMLTAAEAQVHLNNTHSIWISKGKSDRIANVYFRVKS